MRTRSCNVARATIVACGTIGLMVSLAGAQATANKNPRQAQQAAAQPTALQLKQQSLTKQQIESNMANANPSQVPQQASQKTALPFSKPVNQKLDDSKLMSRQNAQATKADGASVRPGSTRVRDNNAAGGAALRGPGFISDCGLTPFPGAPEGSYAFDTSGGSVNGHISSCGPTSNVAVWMTYTATASGIATVTTCGGSADDTIVSVYTDCPIEFGGVEIACNDDDCGGGNFFASTVTFPVNPGDFFAIRIGGFLDDVVAGTLTISVDASPAPANDNCDVSNPALDLGMPTFADNLGATTAAPITPATCGGFPLSGGGSDVFYQFTAGADETYRFSTCGSALDTVIAVFSGCPADEFVNLLGCNDDFCGLQSSLDVPLTNGQLVYVRVAGYGDAQGSFQVQVDVAPPPASNENCDVSNPEVFLNTFESGDTSGAATDVTVDGACTFGGLPSTNDVFYRFTAPAAGCYDFSLCGSGYDTHISVFSGCPADQGTNLLACNDDFCGLQSQVSNVELAASQEVYIRVAGWNGATGSFTLTVTDSPAPTPPPVCVDDSTATFFENEANCGAGGDTVNGGCNSPTLAVQTVNVGDIIYGSGAFNGATRDTDWYEFTVGADTEVTLSLTPEFTADIFFLDTACPPNLLSAGVTVPACTPGSVSLCFAPGTYRFFIGANFAAGPTACAGCGLADGSDYVATLTGVACVVPPHPCTNAVVVSAPSVTNGSTVGATPSGTVTCGANSPDVFYSLTAPVTGSYTIDTCAFATFDTRLSIFTDCPTLTQIACNDDFCGLQSSITLDLTAGVTYYIRVSAFGLAAVGDFTLTISAPPIPTGACCIADVCSVDTEANCLANSGDYQGDGTNCDGGITGGSISVSSPAAAIPDSTFGSLTDTLTGTGGTISNLLVTLQIDHTWQGDLRVELTHVFSGTTVTLVDRPGNPQTAFGFSADNYGSSGDPFILFDGAVQTYDAPQVAVPGILNVSGTWKPDLGPLSAFNGLNANSDWTLTITDNAGGDVGTLNTWSIIVNPLIDGPCSGPQFCDADWCQDGSKSVADIFCFLADWFANDPDARNYGGASTPVQAIFAWLAVWFATPNGLCVP